MNQVECINVLFCLLQDTAVRNDYWLKRPENQTEFESANSAYQS